MNINEAKIILNLHNTLSINKTAEFFNYVPQSIYKCLDSIEKELNCKIVNRSIANGISFTSFGENIIPDLEEIVVRYNNIISVSNKPKARIAYFAPISANFNLDIHYNDNVFLKNKAEFLSCSSIEDAYNMLKGHIVDLFVDYKENCDEFFFLPILRDQIYVITVDNTFANTENIDLQSLQNKTILIDSTKPKMFIPILDKLEKQGCTIIESKIDSRLWFSLNYPDTFFLTTGQFTYFFPEKYYRIAINNQFYTIGLRYNNNNQYIIDFMESIKSKIKKVYLNDPNIID